MTDNGDYDEAWDDDGMTMLIAMMELMLVDMAVVCEGC